jgi:L-alanine-DL-glutamate epimerase-like enolase superfamily enzyme
VIDLTFQRLVIPFRQSFKHGSAERTETQAVWVTATRDGVKGVGEGCPREYVTGESLESAARFLRAGRDAWAELANLEAMVRWVGDHETVIDADPAAWCAVETALLDLFAREDGVSVETAVSLPPARGTYRYTAVVGDGAPEVTRKIVGRYRQMGFTDFKVKISGDLARDRETLSILSELGVEPARMRVDANNLWTDAKAAARHLVALDVPFFGIEEPVGAGQTEALREISRDTKCRIILDESMLGVRHMDGLRADPDRWILNVRVSKMGGILRSCAVIDRARDLGLDIVVGAQVGESSLLTRAGISIACAAGDLLVGHEGAFGDLLLERDVCTEPLKFGAGGVLDANARGLAERPGWGIEVGEGAEVFEDL